TNLPSDSRLTTCGPGQEKDPGSAFGPESVPLATGSVPVVYWVPGPFPDPPPVQPDERGKPSRPSWCHACPGGGQQLTPDSGHVNHPPCRYTTKGQHLATICSDQGYCRWSG